MNDTKRSYCSRCRCSTFWEKIRDFVWRCRSCGTYFYEKLPKKEFTEKQN